MNLYLRLLLCLILGSLTTPKVKAESTKDFEERIFERTYELIHYHTYEQSNLKVADSIYNVSKAQGSQFGMLCANRLRMFVYVAIPDSANLVAATDEAIELSEQLHDTEAYAEAQNVKIQFYIGQEHYLKALQLTQDMLKKSVNSPVLLKQSNILMANIYQNRDIHQVAIQYFEKALEQTDENDSISRFQTYRSLAESYGMLSKREEALRYAKLCLDYAGKDGVYYYWGAFTYLYNLFSVEEYDTFLSEYKRMDLLNQPIDGLLPEYMRNQLRLRYEILHGHYDKALELAEAIEYKSLRLPSIILVYKMSGKADKALEYTEMFNDYEDSVRTAMTMDEMLEINAQIGLDRLKIENKELEARNQRITLISIIVVILIGLATLLVLLYRRRVHINQLNLKNHELFQTNQLLNLKNDELSKARDEAERSSQLKTRFMQNMTHEIRTPLNAISGFAQMLTHENTLEEREEYAKIIVENTTSVTTMLNDMLLLSDLDGGTYQFDKKDIAAIEPQIIALNQAESVIPANITFECPIELDDNVTLHTDAKLLQIVLSKLIDNAAKFTKQGKITLQCQQTTDQHIQYIITDTGCGIPADWESRIFDRFTKINDFVPGVGIGLTICREAVELLGGKIQLDSNYQEQGTRFIIDFPAQQSTTTN